MKSRIVRPVRQREESRKSEKRKKTRISDTQPMRPVRTNERAGSLSDNRSVRGGYRRAGSVSDTQPMRPVNFRSGYAGYKRSIEQRRQIVQTPYPNGEDRSAKKRARRAEERKSTSKGTLTGGVSKSAAADRYFDYNLLLVIIFLMCFGLVMLYSTSAYEANVDFGNDLYYFTRQALIGLLGVVAMFVVSKIDYHIYGAFAAEIFGIAMFLMFLVRTPLGVTLNGARRWIGIGSLTLQPAEVTKIAVILFISYMLCRLGKKAYTMEGIIRVLIYGAVASGGVLFLTDNLSTAIIVMAITCILIFVIHPKLKPFLIIIAVTAAVAVIGIAILSVTVANSDNFRLQRIISWLNPEATADTGSYQVMQGLYAIGSGGFFGKGLGNSTQKLGVIPEAQNDMILVVICEELGVFGAIIILLLFGLLLYRLMFIAKNAPDLYGSLIATGIFAHIALQVILNIAVVTGMLPTTGITLPFISYGGTAILFLMAEMGVALGISRRIRLEGD